MTPDEFRKHAHGLVEWMAGYMENVESLPVKSSINPGDIFDKIPGVPPLHSESFDSLMRDFNEIIMPGILTGRIQIFLHISRQTQALHPYLQKCLSRHWVP